MCTKKLCWHCKQTGFSEDEYKPVACNSCNQLFNFDGHKVLALASSQKSSLTTCFTFEVLVISLEISNFLWPQSLLLYLALARKLLQSRLKFFISPVRIQKNFSKNSEKRLGDQFVFWAEAHSLSAKHLESIVKFCMLLFDCRFNLTYPQKCLSKVVLQDILPVILQLCCATIIKFQQRD